MFRSSLLISFFITASVNSYAQQQCDISGVWQHAGKPAELLINMEKGEMSVYTHQQNPEAEGLVVIKQLSKANTENQWLGKMYNAADNNFIEVTLSSPHCTKLTVTDKGKAVLTLLTTKKSPER